MERFWRYKLDHIIFWTATIAFHTFTRVSLIPQVGVAQFLLEVALRNFLLAVAIYVNLLVLIPKFAQEKKMIQYLGLLVLDIACYVIAKNAHDVYLYGYVMGEAQKQNLFYNTFYNFSILIFYMAFSVALQLSREWFEQRELIQRIEFEKINTELDYLKAQINPHFLFNSINTIYFQIDKGNVKARETLSSFSEMLRYQLYECNGKEIPIEKEINYIRHYVDLQRQRKEENYNITFVHDKLEGFTVPPLLLIPFIENAFKHVSHFQSGNEITIKLSRNNDHFLMNVSNTKDPNPVNHANGGIGLKNVKRRLELLFRDRYSLDIQSRQEHFDVKLKIKLHNHES